MDRLRGYVQLKIRRGRERERDRERVLNGGQMYVRSSALITEYESTNMVANPTRNQLNRENILVVRA